MNFLVIDGMGGGIGKSIIEHIKGWIGDNGGIGDKSRIGNAKIIAVGTNSIATSAMLKAGADYGATGENAVVYNCAKADYIIGVMGIVITNSMHGEISPKMAEAVASSAAHKILIPMDKCNVTVLGVAEKTMQAYISELTLRLGELTPPG